jgi:imidazolonepropionase-like amidohydrolase
MKIAVLIVRSLLGLVFLVFGLNAFLQFLKGPIPGGLAGQFLQALFQSHYVLGKEMRFEREFVAAGGLLTAGCDPSGYGGVVPGFGDQRNIELLVEAGFSSVEAIRIATLNGAIYMGTDSSIGSIAPGKAPIWWCWAATRRRRLKT